MLHIFSAKINLVKSPFVEGEYMPFYKPGSCDAAFLICMCHFLVAYEIRALWTPAGYPFFVISVLFDVIFFLSLLQIEASHSSRLFCGITGFILFSSVHTQILSICQYRRKQIIHCKLLNQAQEKYTRNMNQKLWSL